MSSGIKKNSLDVFIGHTQKIGAIALDIGSENEFAISLPRMQLLMSQTVDSVLAAIDMAKVSAVKNNLSTAELAHIDLCIKIINKAANKLSEQIIQLPNMDAFI
ncbi:hypothetical protein [Pseudoalteromonas arctica]|uniref:Uncharacterized protein n=1 Tax=Pseudoalteromonas arctica TaxID=394751 RepID=A0ABU9TJ82_9GAMM